MVRSQSIVLARAVEPETISVAMMPVRTSAVSDARASTAESESGMYRTSATSWRSARAEGSSRAAARAAARFRWPHSERMALRPAPPRPPAPTTLPSGRTCYLRPSRRTRTRRHARTSRTASAHAGGLTTSRPPSAADRNRCAPPCVFLSSAEKSPHHAKQQPGIGVGKVCAGGTIAAGGRQAPTSTRVHRMCLSWQLRRSPLAVPALVQLDPGRCEAEQCWTLAVSA